MQDVLRFWLERGVDGYRIDAIDRLLKDPQLRDDPPATEPFGLPLTRGRGQARAHQLRATRPTPARRSAQIREAAGDAFLVGEVYLPSARWQPYSRPLRRGVRLRAAALALGRRARCAPRSRPRTRQPGAAWVMSNHDFGRLATRFGRRERARRRAAAAHAARARRSSTRATRSGRARARRASARFDRAGPRPLPPPDAVGRLAEGGFTDRRALAAAGRPGASATSRTSATTRLDAVAGPRADRAAARAGRTASSCSTRPTGVVAFRRGGHTVAINTTPSRCPRRSRASRVYRRSAGVRCETDCSPRTQARLRWVRRLPPRGTSALRRRGTCTDDICSPPSRSQRALALAACGVGSAEGGGGTNAINWYVFNEPGGVVRQGGRRLQQAGRRQVPHQLREAADRREPAARADRPPPGRQGQRHRPDRHGRDLDRRAGRGGLDPAVDRPATATSRRRASSQGPLKTVEYKGKV